MGLEQTYSDPATGQEVPDAYHQITEAVIAPGWDLKVTAAVYVSREARRGGLQPVAHFEVLLQGDDFAACWKSAVLGGGNLMDYLYGYLKGLPSYAGARDA